MKLKITTEIINDRSTSRKKQVYRFATSMFRGLPDIFIINAQKAGTTSLFRYLEQHPRITGSHPKEVHYFVTTLI